MKWQEGTKIMFCDVFIYFVERIIDLFLKYQTTRFFPNFFLRSATSTSEDWEGRFPWSEDCFMATFVPPSDAQEATLPPLQKKLESSFEGRNHF